MKDRELRQKVAFMETEVLGLQGTVAAIEKSLGIKFSTRFPIQDGYKVNIDSFCDVINNIQMIKDYLKVEEKVFPKEIKLVKIVKKEIK